MQHHAIHGARAEAQIDGEIGDRDDPDRAVDRDDLRREIDVDQRGRDQHARHGERSRRIDRADAAERGVQLGMTFLDGTSVRAHQKAAGAAGKGATRRDGVRVRRLAALVAAMERKPA